MRLAISGGDEAGRTVDISTTTLVIGRDARCEVVLDDRKVSRRHAIVEVIGSDRALVRDLGSGNGTFVNNVRISGPTSFRRGDTLRVGTTLLSFADEGSEPPVVPVGRVGDGAGPPEPTFLAPVQERHHDSVVVRLRRSVRRSTWLAGGALALLVLVATAFGLVVTEVIALPGRTPTVEEIIDAVTPSTVVVVTDVGAGTGWVYDAERGLVVTNQHVIDGAGQVVVGIDGEERDASLIGSAPCEDLAVLEVADTSGLATMELGSQGDLRLGQSVVALGYPDNGTFDVQLTATTGVVSVPRTSFPGDGSLPTYPNVVQTDAAINPGNSGGPLVDRDMRLIGVNSLGRELDEVGTIIQGQNFAIGVDRVKDIVLELAEGRSLGWTGAFLQPVTQASELTVRGLPTHDGLLITGVAPDTAAATVGLGEEDALLVAIDGSPLRGGVQGYCEAVGTRSAGDQATFTLVTSGSSEVTDLEVGFE